VSGQLAAMETDAVETLPPRMGLTRADEHDGLLAVTFGIAAAQQVRQDVCQQKGAPSACIGSFGYLRRATR
jgi:hypothetical protein